MGRGLRIIELKKEVNELCHRLGEVGRYPRSSNRTEKKGLTRRDRGINHEFLFTYPGLHRVNPSTNLLHSGDRRRWISQTSRWNLFFPDFKLVLDWVSTPVRNRKSSALNRLDAPHRKSIAHG